VGAPVNHLIERINIKHLSVPLIGAEFRRHGRVWTKRRADRIDLVEVVLGKWNEGETGRFTVELGVAYPELLTMVAAIEAFRFYRPYLDRPAIEACQIRERLGFLLSPAEDRWWEVAADGPTEPIGEAVAGALGAAGLAWFGRQPT